ncbi:MAG: GIY-YIG nuclease family protein [Candidatus Omnitrophota bacterium]
MLVGLKKEKISGRGKKTGNDWSLYILQCRDGSFYTGITNHLERRLQMHQDGKASRYTRTRRPVEMLYSETCGDRSRALIRECEVKEWPRTKKVALINQQGKSPKPARRAKRNAQRKTDRLNSYVER